MLSATFYVILVRALRGFSFSGLKYQELSMFQTNFKSNNLCFSFLFLIILVFQENFHNNFDLIYQRAYHSTRA